MAYKKKPTLEQSSKDTELVGTSKARWNPTTQSYTGPSVWADSKVNPTPEVRIPRIHCVGTGRTSWGVSK